MDMTNRRTCPGTGIALKMSNQQLTYQGLGSLRLLLGFLILFVIWHQCRAFPFLDGKCPTPPTNCEHGLNKTPVYVNPRCLQYFCYQGSYQDCNDKDLQCADGLTCECGKCMNCLDNICKLDLCPQQDKRFSKRFPIWYQLARWENLPQKYIKPNYDDKNIKLEYTD